MKINKALSSFINTDLLMGFDASVCGLSDDSRVLQQGEAFIACAGEVVDGRDYIDAAIKAGAAAVLAEQGGQWRNSQLYQQVPVIVIDALPHKIADISCRFYGYPSQDLSVIGITGTNAKTSCSSYLKQSFGYLKERAGIVGTLGWGCGDELVSTDNTTPNSLNLQKVLWGIKQQKASRAVLEVSSHGLELGRTQGVSFDVAVFTNLSRDHLDFHGDMQSYLQAKLRLFKVSGLRLAVINIDDEHAQAFIDVLDDTVKLITYGRSSHADVRLSELSSSLNGLHLDVMFADATFSFGSVLLGDFNAHNLLAVIAVLWGLDYEPSMIVDAVQQVVAVQGRMESLTENDVDIQVVVDYAHTPDGLEKALQSLKAYEPASLWCVFGCGGDRDKGKRALMGSIASVLADKIIITNDNPRTEQPKKIVDDILQGVSSLANNVVVELDREKAIDYAVTNIQKGGCVLIAGKGHETYQEVNRQRIFFSDQYVARNALLERARLAS